MTISLELNWQDHGDNAVAFRPDGQVFATVVFDETEGAWPWTVTFFASDNRPGTIENYFEKTTALGKVGWAWSREPGAKPIVLEKAELLEHPTDPRVIVHRSDDRWFILDVSDLLDEEDMDEDDHVIVVTDRGTGPID